MQQRVSPEGLTARRSTFRPAEVLEAICGRLPSGGQVTEIVALADAFVASPHVVTIDPPQPTAGHLNTNPFNAAFGRWTTPEMLTTERHLLDLVAASRHAGAWTTTLDHLGAALAARQSLDPEQAAMVRQLRTSRAGVEVIEESPGQAGLRPRRRERRLNHLRLPGPRRLPRAARNC